MPITLEELQGDFNRWLEAYAYKVDPDTKVFFLTKKENDVYSITKWTHSSNAPTFQQLTETLDPEDLVAYDKYYKIHNFLTQADIVFKAGYSLFWREIKRLDGVEFETGDDLLNDLRAKMIEQV